jgi:hypothetical protein
MFSERMDAFEDVASEEAESQRERYERARDLLAEQTAELLEGGSSADPCDEPVAHHTPHNPHWRGLSSAARRLVRAHECLEGALEGED